MEVGFGPGFSCGLDELPVVEAGTEFARGGLVLSRAVVLAEVVVGEAEGFGEEPAFALVLAHEGRDAGFVVAVGGFDVSLEIGESDLTQDSLPQLGGLVFVDPPEASGVSRSTGA